MSFNHVTLLGRASSDPSMISQRAHFTIAVPAKLVPAPHDHHFRIVTLDHDLSKWVHDTILKGRLVLVSGELMNRKYSDVNGNIRELVEIVATTVQAVDRPTENQFKPAGQLAGGSFAE